MIQKYFHNETTISKYLQLNIPKIEKKVFIGYKSGEESSISRENTGEKYILRNMLLEDVAVRNMSYTISGGNKIFDLSITDGNKSIEEPFPTSNQTNYGKAHVLFDNDKNVFIVDYTENNNRIHLQHGSGSYWTFRDDGSYIFKLIPSGKNQIKHTTFIGGEKEEVIKDSFIQKIGKSRHIHILGEDSIVSGKLTRDIGGDDFKRVSGISLENSSRKHINTQFMSIDATDTLILKSNNLVFQTNNRFIFDTDKDFSIFTGKNLEFKVGTSFTERIQGVRESSASSIIFSTKSGDLQLSSGGGNVSIHSAGLYFEQIDNFVVQSADVTVAKKVDINIGSYNLNIRSIGDISMTTKVGRLKNNYLVGSASYGSSVGIGELSISILGKTEMGNLLGKVGVNELGLVNIKSPTTTLYQELDLLLTELISMATNISSLTCIYALGTTSPPVNAAAFVAHSVKFSTLKAKLLTLLDPIG